MIELTINGKTKEFDSGFEAWKWATKVSKRKLEDNYDEKNGPTLSDFFARRYEYNKKKVKNAQS